MTLKDKHVYCVDGSNVWIRKRETKTIIINVYCLAFNKNKSKAHFSTDKKLFLISLVIEYAFAPQFTHTHTPRDMDCVNVIYFYGPSNDYKRLIIIIRMNYMGK